MRRVGFMIWKELLELKGDPRLFGLVIIAPILQLFMLGYAARPPTCAMCRLSSPTPTARRRAAT
jgi:hypothetical protein